MTIKQRSIRGHHLLCLHGFQGIGYSESFVDGMSEYVRDMKKTNQPLHLKIIIGQDELCKNCPHDGDDICLSNNSLVQKIDEEVIKKLQLKPNKVYEKEFLLKKTAKHIHPNDLETICNGCQWLEMGVCKEGIKRLQTNFQSFFE